MATLLLIVPVKNEIIFLNSYFYFMLNKSRRFPRKLITDFSCQLRFLLLHYSVLILKVRKLFAFSRCYNFYFCLFFIFFSIFLTLLFVCSSFFVLFHFFSGMFAVAKLRGSRSQLERASSYLKRGVGAFRDKEKEKDRDDRLDDRFSKKKRSKDKGNDSDLSGDEGKKNTKDEGKDRERKSFLDRDSVSESVSSSMWKSHAVTEKDREKDKTDEGHSVAVTVPCPASRAGCLIGSKGAIVKEIMRRTTARITISDEVILKLSPLALATNKDMTPDPTGYRWVTIKVKIHSHTPYIIKHI